MADAGAATRLLAGGVNVIKIIHCTKHANLATAFTLNLKRSQPAVAARRPLIEFCASYHQQCKRLTRTL
eukprot:6202962-Pleurochrysis_carterae.AAC.3